jgi:two-component system, sensor histidine kinase RegB
MDLKEWGDMQALSWHNLRRFTAALSAPSRERSGDRAAASPGDERVARMGALLAGAAHELCSPLTTMAVLVEELRQRPEADDRREVAESLRIMSDQIEACRSILSRLAEHGGRVSGLSGGGTRSLSGSDAAAQALQLSTGV